MDLCTPLREIYPGQPGRFYASAISMVLYTYESWLAIQQNLRRRLDGKQRWLDIVKSDRESIELSGSSLDVIKQQAQDMLNEINAEQSTQSVPNVNLMSCLFKSYAATEDILSHCAIAHLLKNDCKVSETEEDPDKFAHRIHSKQKQIEELDAQLNARLPKVRDLTGSEFLETLEIATQQISENVIQARECDGKGDPWTVNRLSLQCTFDTRLMTAEGTLAVQQEKSAKAIKNLENENADPRNQSTLDRLKNLPDRPSKKPYKGNPEILVGLSIGLANPVTAAVVNVRTGDVVTYRTPKTLLGDRYRLFNRHRIKQQQNSLQRQKKQKLGIAHQPSESERGEYVDRLLANEIVKLAQQYRADSIVIPTLTHVRTVLASEITARAEQKCPGSVEAQKKYAKDYQIAISRWSYNRLIKNIHSKAQQLGIAVESGFQPARASPQEQAKDIAIATYHSRQNSTQ